MKCSNCDSQMICEDLGDGKKKYTCQKCGESRIEDKEGRKLLTERDA